VTTEPTVTTEEDETTATTVTSTTESETSSVKETTSASEVIAENPVPSNHGNDSSDTVKINASALPSTGNGSNVTFVILGLGVILAGIVPFLRKRVQK